MSILSCVGDLLDVEVSFKCVSDNDKGVGLVEGEGEEEVPGGICRVHFDFIFDLEPGGRPTVK